MAALTGDDLAGFILGAKTAVESSNVAWIRWESDNFELTIGFNNGSIYAYSGVSEDIAEDFARADSKGSWVAQRLRQPKWAFTCLVRAVGKKG